MPELGGSDSGSASDGVGKLWMEVESSDPSPQVTKRVPGDREAVDGGSCGGVLRKVWGVWAAVLAVEEAVVPNCGWYPVPSANQGESEGEVKVYWDWGQCSGVGAALG